ncbi:MAG: DUF2088 domain-containing protein, partial [Acidobacteria bacterium]|nr:DUF2088 domain-containing protein [Acidobacteriota bacterium]
MVLQAGNGKGIIDWAGLMNVISRSVSDEGLTRADLAQLVREAAGALGINRKRVLVIIPDGTRTMPMPLMFELFAEEIAPCAAALDYLVALGTHQPMNEAELKRFL